MADQFFELPMDDYNEWCTSKQLPKFVLKQIRHWVTQKNIIEFDQMTNISKKNNAICKEHLRISPFKSITPLPAKDGSAVKYIFELFPLAQAVLFLPF